MMSSGGCRRALLAFTVHFNTTGIARTQMHTYCRQYVFCDVHYKTGIILQLLFHSFFLPFWLFYSDIGCLMLEYHRLEGQTGEIPITTATAKINRKISIAFPDYLAICDRHIPRKLLSPQLRWHIISDDSSQMIGHHKGATALKKHWHGLEN